MNILKQRNYYPLFLTDTEEAALLLDLWSRVYKYPLEYLIEAMAPTSEMDFDMLPTDKQELYKAIQTHHVNASPDGPWFFIIARNDVRNDQFQLIGITDTAMLRPQVFALQEGDSTDRSDLLGKAGYRCNANLTAKRRSALRAHRRQILECPRRQLYRWRFIYFQPEGNRSRDETYLYR